MKQMAEELGKKEKAVQRSREMTGATGCVCVLVNDGTGHTGHTGHLIGIERVHSIISTYHRQSTPVLSYHEEKFANATAWHGACSVNFPSIKTLERLNGRTQKCKNNNTVFGVEKRETRRYEQIWVEGGRRRERERGQQSLCEYWIDFNTRNVSAEKFTIIFIIMIIVDYYYSTKQIAWPRKEKCTFTHTLICIILYDDNMYRAA